MSDQISKTEFAKLPNWVQQKIKELEVSDPEQWIQKSIPALGNRSLVETIASPNGEAVAREYFAKVFGRF